MTKRSHSRQREQILEFLTSTPEHPTAAEVASAMERLHGQASTSSVYRNLEILVARGDVKKVRLDDGPDRFDANLDPHYHVVCTHCHGLWDVPVGEGDRCDFTLPEGFGPQAWEITVRGTCAACARETHPFHH